MGILGTDLVCIYPIRCYYILFALLCVKRTFKSQVASDCFSNLDAGVSVYHWMLN